MAIGGGILFILFFPRDNANPINLFGYQYFNERERYILRQRLILDDPSKARKGGRHVPREDLRRVVSIQLKSARKQMTNAFNVTVHQLAPHSPHRHYYRRYRTHPGPRVILASAGHWNGIRSSRCECLGLNRRLAACVCNPALGLPFVSLSCEFHGVSRASELTFDFSRDKFKIPGRLVFLGLLLYWAFTVCESVCSWTLLLSLSSLQNYQVIIATPFADISLS